MKEKLGSKEERIALWISKKAMLNLHLPWRKSGLVSIMTFSPQHCKQNPVFDKGIGFTWLPSTISEQAKEICKGKDFQMEGEMIIITCWRPIFSK